MPQTSVRTSMIEAMNGQIADLANAKVVSRVNNAKQRDKVEITAANKLTTLTLNGTAFTVNSASGTLTIENTVSALKTAINAGSEPITCVASTSADLTIEADVSGVEYSAAATTNCALSAVISYDASADIPAGVLVTQDTTTGNENTCKLPTAATDVTNAAIALGVVVRSQALENPSSGSTVTDKKSAIGIMTEGNIYVQVESAVDQTKSVYVRYTAATGKQVGQFGGDSASGAAAVLPGARWMSKATAGGTAVLAINLP